MAPDAPQNKLLKKSYRVKAKLEVFYTGGPIATPESAEFVVCPCADSVKAVELGTSAVIRSFSGDSEPITAVAVSPDGKSIFGSSRSLQTKMWAFESGECRRSWKVRACFSHFFFFKFEKKNRASFLCLGWRILNCLAPDTRLSRFLPHNGLFWRPLGFGMCCKWSESMGRRGRLLHTFVSETQRDCQHRFISPRPT